MSALSLIGPTAFDRLRIALEADGRPITTPHEHELRSRCPAHDGTSAASLSVKRIEGSVLVHCFGGCATEAVLSALGLSARDLYDEAKGARYDYLDARGALLRSVHRTPEKRFRQSGPSTTGTSTLYRLSEVIAAVAAGVPVYVVEGEKDVHSLEVLGAVATTAPGGGGNWRKVDATPLSGADVIVVPDLDATGETHRAAVLESLLPIAESVQVGRPVVGKDASDHVAAGHGLGDLAPVPVHPPGSGSRFPTPGVGTGEPQRFPVPGTAPEPVPEPEWDAYCNVGVLLDGGMPESPTTDVLARSDGVCIFYAGQVNLLFGDPESGKTFVALAAAAESLRLGRSALVIDLDHNGPQATIGRLMMLGAPVTALRDRTRFRYVEPEDALHVDVVVADAQDWHPSVAVVDSVGELLPVYGASSNSPDDFTRVHSRVMKPLAMAGSCVICIDHLAKNAESRAQGATGTAAKGRAIGGVSVRVKVADAFVPGKGGSAHLTIHKDRHGGLRRWSPTGDHEPMAGTFILATDATGSTSWRVTAAAMTDRNPDELVPSADVATVAALVPPPTSVEDARARLGWRKTRAADALREWRKQGSVTAVPGSHTGGAEPGTASGTEALLCATCDLPMIVCEPGQLIHPGCEAVAL